VAREAKKQVADEAAEHQRRLRAIIAAKPKYKTHDVDPFSRYAGRSEALKRANAGKKMPWGKHKGKLISQVPTSYLQWVANQDWFHKHGRKFVDTVNNELGVGPAQLQAEKFLKK
jgi:hypothetical protein